MVRPALVLATHLSGPALESVRLNECLFQDLAAAKRAFCRLFQNVIRHAGIGAGHTVDDVIEWNLGTVRIAAFAGFNQPLGFAQGCGADEHHVLLFGRGIEEVARHGCGFYHCGLVIDSDWEVLPSTLCRLYAYRG